MGKMTLRGRYWFWKLAIASLLAMSGAIASRDSASAQITPDGTLGAESSVVTPTTANGLPSNQIDGGAERGANLFHSFDEFSIPTGSEASFNNAASIQNIISRVTGASISNIDGLLRANANANLFLLNPNGIIFGSNASLNIGGSFVGSTASSLNFADGTQFSATAPTTTPLLSVSLPIGLQYGETVGSIRNQSRATNSSGRFVGLEVQPGKTLALMGGDVTLEGGGLQALGGRVELGGLASSGSIELSINGSQASLSFPDGVARANVYLTNLARVYVAASNDGSIAITAQEINITGDSELRAGIAPNLGFPGAQAGDIEINATGAITVVDSDLFNRVGDLDAIADPNTGRRERQGVGNGGNINITTGSLSVTNGSLLSATTFGQGNAGNVMIRAQGTVSFDRVLGTNREVPSSVVTRAATRAVGNAGNIDITTGSLSVSNGANLISTSNGPGNAGNVTIIARDTVAFDGAGSNGEESSRAVSRLERSGVSNGGNINITTGSLAVTNGGQLVANTRGKGNAGSVNINARDTVTFDGVSSNGLFPSEALSRVSSGAVGNGGNINITTGLLSVTNGASLGVESQGNGAAGNIEVAADSIRLSNLASINANTTTGQGNIFLRSEDLVLRRGSSITTNATDAASGGNINIDAGVIAALENSDISANSDNSFGGRVTINAQGIFGTEFRDQLTLLSDITATGGSPELSGSVEINNPDVDPSQGLFALPTELVDASGLIASGCGASRTQGESKFVVTGRGGLPMRPRDADLSPYPTGTVRSIPNSSPSSDSLFSSVEGSDPSTNLTSRAPTQIVEATGWVTNNKGEVVLVATAPTATPNIPWLPSATCQTP